MPRTERRCLSAWCSLFLAEPLATTLVQLVCQVWDYHSWALIHSWQKLTFRPKEFLNQRLKSLIMFPGCWGRPHQCSTDVKTSASDSGAVRKWQVSKDREESDPGGICKPRESPPTRCPPGPRWGRRRSRPPSFTWCAGGEHTWTAATSPVPAKHPAGRLAHLTWTSSIQPSVWGWYSFPRCPATTASAIGSSCPSSHRTAGNIQFVEQDLKTPLPGTLTFRDPEKI
jgi:hypothetical protein